MNDIIILEDTYLFFELQMKCYKIQFSNISTIYLIITSNVKLKEFGFSINNNMEKNYLGISNQDINKNNIKYNFISTR